MSGPGDFSGGNGAPDLATTQEALDQVGRDFDAILRGLDGPELMTRLCEVAVNMIRLRTYAGIDVNGNAFEPYSEKWELTWAEIREAAGLPTDRVTLCFSGGMMQAISYEVLDARSARLFVKAVGFGGNPTARDLVAEGHQKGNRTLPQREWFGFTEAQKEILQREAVAFLTGLLLASRSMTASSDDVSVMQDRYEVVPFDPPTADYAALAGVA